MPRSGRNRSLQRRPTSPEVPGRRGAPGAVQPEEGLSSSPVAGAVSGDPGAETAPDPPPGQTGEGAAAAPNQAGSAGLASRAEHGKRKWRVAENEEPEVETGQTQDNPTPGATGEGAPGAPDRHGTSVPARRALHGEGEGQEPTAGQEQEAATDAPAEGTQPIKSQADFERALQQRLKALERKKYGDYAQLKAAAEELQQIKDAAKTEEQKMRERLARLEADAQNAQRTAREKALEAQIVAEAARQKVNDPQDVYRLLAIGDLEVGEDGQIVDLETAIKDLIAAKPYLKQKDVPSVPPANPARNAGDQKRTDEDRYRTYFGGGRSDFFGS